MIRPVNVFVLKGVLLDACKEPAGDQFKCRVFGATSYPGFVNSTYNVIGVEFGLGIMELDENITGESAIAKIQVWNLNENSHFSGNWKHFSRGSRFAIICWNQEMDPEATALLHTIKHVVSACPSINIGIVAIVDGDLPLEGIIDDCIEHLPSGTAPGVARNLDDMVSGLVVDCITQTRSLYMLPLGSAAEIEPVDCIRNPFNNYTSRASPRLIDLLREEFTIENGCIRLDRGAHVITINLDNSSLHACLAACETCRNGGCNQRGRTTRICVVLDSCQHRGWASTGSGLSDGDLFILSMIYSVTNSGALPASITSQLPKCPRKKKG